MASGSTPSPTTSACSPTSNDVEHQRKRARDRKSQQAMRDRKTWTIQNLTENVAFLNRIAEENAGHMATLNARLQAVVGENERLRIENAALQLRLMGDRPLQESSVFPLGAIRPLWETPPSNTAPTCLADQILQTFAESKRRENIIPAERAAAYPSTPNLCSLLDKNQRTEDATSNVVSDIIRSYTEIATLPKQVAVHYVMSTLLKWTVLLDEHSYNLMPRWLKPIPQQLTTPHAMWIDRIPWPKVRGYLVAHPNITLDDFAGTYSTSFSIAWPYDPSLVVYTTSINEKGVKQVVMNPIYSAHIRQLTNWTVGGPFRNRFPEVAKLIDEDIAESSNTLL
ncbi:hypothetical protein EJ08DRAFT_701479 [Tothia fuscella]|uniref:BZIP transcription factor n=1 Tax=Tothia fuscella TaxID=1048955 RepID=A0A9P4TUT6_9PEZI|nr:hypothetical protein EJ08DRAFT_701479 [Tothia fuscella]